MTIQYQGKLPLLDSIGGGTVTGGCFVGSIVVSTVLSGVIFAIDSNYYKNN